MTPDLMKCLLEELLTQAGVHFDALDDFLDNPQWLSPSIVHHQERLAEERGREVIFASIGSAELRREYEAYVARYKTHATGQETLDEARSTLLLLTPWTPTSPGLARARTRRLSVAQRVLDGDANTRPPLQSFGMWRRTRLRDARDSIVFLEEEIERIERALVDLREALLELRAAFPSSSMEVS